MAEGLSVRLRQRAPIPLEVALEVAPGELLALVGPSGSGKSSVLRAIAGLLRPREGRIACAGETWLDAGAGLSLPPQRRRVGFVFQHYALFPHMSALDNVAAALGHWPQAGRAARAREWLARVHLAGLEERKPVRLSGGQQQRVAVARALAGEPRALLLDEPFSAVDQVTRRKLYRELAELRRTLPIPQILVTHDLDEAALLADRIAVLHHGRTLQTGPPAELLARPASPLVARLLDQRNLFEGTVLGHEPERTWIAWAGRRLEARPAPGFAPGARVAWLIPEAQVRLLRRDPPGGRRPRDNVVTGTVVEMLALGGRVQVTLAPDGRAEAPPIAFSVAAHIIGREGIAPGAELRLSLLAAGLHLMPPEPA